MKINCPNCQTQFWQEQPPTDGWLVCPSCKVLFKPADNQSSQGTRTIPQVPMIPDKIRESLKAFKEHEQTTCLGCGYSGLMGVKKKVKPWYFRGCMPYVLAIACALFIELHLFGDLGEVGRWAAVAIFGIGYGLASVVNTKTFVHCPNCDKELS
jgi:DNA-directed RNA polymerase subunit RPC12/RpoP